MPFGAQFFIRCASNHHKLSTPPPSELSSVIVQQRYPIEEFSSPIHYLGTGRPFAFECINSKKTRLSTEDRVELENFINSHHEEGIDLYCVKKVFGFL